jgi:dihydrofolate reductase
MNDYSRIWHGANKIVYSTTLTELAIDNATIERSFDPEVVQKLVAESDKDTDIGGPQLVSEAIKAGILDEIHLIIAPVIIGNGKPWLAKDITAKLELVDTRTFDNGFVHLHYRKIQ